MRILATLLLAAGALVLPSQADDGCSSAQAETCSAIPADQSCLHRCPVAREATTLGRRIVVALPVAVVDRSELEA